LKKNILLIMVSLLFVSCAVPIKGARSLAQNEQIVSDNNLAPTAVFTVVPRDVSLAVVSVPQFSFKVSDDQSVEKVVILINGQQMDVNNCLIRVNSYSCGISNAVVGSNTIDVTVIDNAGLNSTTMYTFVAN